MSKARIFFFVALAAASLVGCGLGATSKVTVYADAESEVTVELLDAKHRVEATVDLHPGESATLEGKSGPHTIRSTKRDGTKHDVALNLEKRKQYAVPTSPDQCFAILNIGPWYSSKARNVDVTDARVEKRTTKSATYGFPGGTYGRIDETPENIEYTERPKLVTAYPCAKIADAAETDILATLAEPVGTTALTSASKAHVPSGPQYFRRLMSDQKKEWTRVYDTESVLAYRNTANDFLIIDTLAIPGESDVADNPKAMTELMASIGQPNVNGVYRRDDLLPSIAVTPPPQAQAVLMGDVRAGLVLRHTDSSADAVVAPEVFTAIGGDFTKAALENAKKRYAELAAKCLEKIPAKPTVCGEDATEATAVLLIAKETPKLKGKIWFRADDNGLQLMKGTKKIPTTGFGDTTTPLLFTLQKNELKLGLE